MTSKHFKIDTKLVCFGKQMILSDLIVFKWQKDVYLMWKKIKQNPACAEGKDIDGAKMWYLAYFGVVNPHKSDRLRIVSKIQEMFLQVAIIKIDQSF